MAVILIIMIACWLMCDIILRKNSVMSHFNSVHCGVEILSMSKRIMNRIFDVSCDCGVKVYFQDTDSIHLHYGDVDGIVKRHKQKYNQDLVGDGLGNFHVDLPPLGENGEVFDIENYFLCKKT